MKYKTHKRIKTIADFLKHNKLPEKQELYCKFCGCDMTHNLYGTSKESIGAAYSCVRCGTTPHNQYEIFMNNCPKCGHKTPHFLDFDNEIGTCNICAKCGNKTPQ